jgi:hypothetical protein
VKRGLNESQRKADNILLHLVDAAGKFALSSCGSTLRFMAKEEK